MLHFLETLFRFPTLAPEEDGGDSEVGAWAAFRAQSKVCSGKSSAFPSYPQPAPSSGEARLQWTPQSRVAATVKFCFGVKSPYFQLTHLSPVLAVAMMGWARLVWLRQAGSRGDLMWQRGPRR